MGIGDEEDEGTRRNYQHQLPITDYQLPITNYPLPITHYQTPN
ncbi:MULTISPECIES: hypothetical protein [unclassified Tolypothrix]|nr:MULTISPECIES: hypothetical protein [unclassified Tolypothrix]